MASGAYTHAYTHTHTHTHTHTLADESDYKKAGAGLKFSVKIGKGILTTVADRSTGVTRVTPLAEYCITFNPELVKNLMVNGTNLSR